MALDLPAGASLVDKARLRGALGGVSTSAAFLAIPDSLSLPLPKQALS